MAHKKGAGSTKNGRDSNAKRLGVKRFGGEKVKAGNILSADEFYGDNFEAYKHWASFGVLCVEMETAAIYTLAAKYKVQALTILTISDELVTGIESTAQERQETLSEMVEIALEL